MTNDADSSRVTPTIIVREKKRDGWRTYKILGIRELENVSTDLNVPPLSGSPLKQHTINWGSANTDW